MRISYWSSDVCSSVLTIDDMWFGRIVLDPVRGAIVSETLDMIERELFEADWDEAKARLGRKPLLDELARTNAQRYADALTEMAIRAQIGRASCRESVCQYV